MSNLEQILGIIRHISSLLSASWVSGPVGVILLSAAVRVNFKENDIMMVFGMETDPILVVALLGSAGSAMLGCVVGPPIAAWWTRDRKLFESLSGLMTHIEDLETGRVWLHYPQLPDVTDQIINEDLERLHDELVHGLKALRIPKPSKVRSEEWNTLLSVVQHGTLRRARKL